MTKAEARRILGIESDYALAKIVGRNRTTISRWGRMVPHRWRSWIMEEGRRREEAARAIARVPF